MEPQAQRRTRLYPSTGGRVRPRAGLRHPVVQDMLKKGSLCTVLVEHLSEGREPAAFDYLFRETSLETLNQCLSEIRDEEVANYLLDSILTIASLLSSEAFVGIERNRRELKTLMVRSGDDLAKARLSYDGHVEILGQYFFAVGRRLKDIESFLGGCPFSGSAENLRGLYGQRVRDLAGDLRFLRMELDRWVRKFVPLDGDLPGGNGGKEFLEARIGTVVDELGLRLKELQESTCFVMFEQLSLFDATLTRKRLFRRDLENQLDLDRFLGWFGELMSRVRDYDVQRQPGQLQKIQELLRGFRPDQFPTLAGVRESDHALFCSFVERLRQYRHGQGGPQDDPVHPFLLLLGDVLKSLNQRSGDSLPMDASPF